MATIPHDDTAKPWKPQQLAPSLLDRAQSAHLAYQSSERANRMNRLMECCVTTLGVAPQNIWWANDETPVARIDRLHFKMINRFLAVQADSGEWIGVTSLAELGRLAQTWSFRTKDPEE